MLWQFLPSVFRSNKLQFRSARNKLKCANLLFYLHISSVIVFSAFIVLKYLLIIIITGSAVVLHCCKTHAKNQ